MDLSRETYMKWTVAAQTADEEAIRIARSYYDRSRGMDITAKQEEQLLQAFTRETVERIKERGFTNLAHRAVQVMHERLAVTGLVPAPGEPGQNAGTAWADQMIAWWKALDGAGLQQDAHKYSLRDRASCLIVGWDTQRNVPTWHVNELWDGESGQCRLHFDPDTDELAFVSKRWNILDEYGVPTGDVRLTLYFPERIERYISTGAPGGWQLLDGDALEAEGVAQNPQPWVSAVGGPLGIAAVPFYNVDYVSECDSLLTLHDAMNRSVLDLILSEQYHGFPMIAFEGAVQFPTDTDTGQPTAPKIGPGRAVAVPGGTVKRIEGADLEMIFRGGPMSLLTLAAYDKGWPIHVFTRIHPAADTIRMSEISLVKQVEAKQVSFGSSWRQVFELTRAVAQAFTGRTYAGGVEPVWAPAQLADDGLDIDLKAKKADAAQLPLEWRLKLFGYTPEDIVAILEARRREVSERVTLALADTIPEVGQ